MNGTTALSDKTALSDRTALSETALSDKASGNVRQIAEGHSQTYTALLSSQSFVLGAWRVYPTRNLIQHRENRDDNRQLEPRLMRLLCLLAASADAVVTRDEIINTLWPRVVVNENSLTRAVSDLRRLLTPEGDKRSDLIQTIPKRGYRLTQAPAVIEAHETACSSQLPTSTSIGTRWLSRWTPSIAACFILALALLTRVSDDGTSAPAMAQLPANGHGAAPLIDQVIDDSERLARLNAEAKTLPAGLQGDDARYPITQLGYASDKALPAWQVARDVDKDQANAMTQGQSMLTPDGQLLAYVDDQNGIFSLNLRPVMTNAEPWVAFTTDERILHLQWSPLDAGILMTVGQITDSNERASYLRLMLLDLETLTVQELYRRDLPAESRPNSIGNLT